ALGGRVLALGGLGLSFAACAPRLGDGCKQGIDCDVRNQRVCDRSQPGGYCTIPNCKPGDCGDDGVCVRFRPDQPRLSVNYCMLKCNSTSDCDRDAYYCRSADAINALLSPDAGAEDETDDQIIGGNRVAEVLDGDGTRKFCIAKQE
ncbi:MAG TPA: hypothetical protein VFZ61_28910, partial [Polyangiales bacterium]